MVSTSVRVWGLGRRRGRKPPRRRGDGWETNLGGVVAAGPHVDVLAVDGDLLAVHLVLFVLHGRRVLSSNLTRE
jgi:hypothetical protein